MDHAILKTLYITLLMSLSLMQFYYEKQRNLDIPNSYPVLPSSGGILSIQRS